MHCRIPITLLCIVVSIATASVAAADVIPSPANDLALASNGTTATSSAGNWDGNHTPAKLIDGNRDGVFENNSVYHSNQLDNGVPIAMTLTFTSAQPLGSMNIFNRTACCGERITPFDLQVFNGGGPAVYTLSSQTFAETISQTVGSSSSSGMSLTFPAGTIGDKIVLTQLNPGNNNPVNLAELEVFGVPEPTSIGLIALGAVMFLRRRRYAKSRDSCRR